MTTGRIGIGRWPIGRGTVADSGAASATLAPDVYRRHHYATIVVFVAGVALVFSFGVQDPQKQYLTDLWLVYAVSAMGFRWIFGLAGRFAFCQTFMMALGGYTSAYIITKLGPSYFLLGLGGAILASGLIAFVVGILTHRAQRFYFAMATLAVSEVGTVVFTNASSFTGPNGARTGIAPAQIGSLVLGSNVGIFWLFLSILALVLFLSAFIEKSPLRREAIAGRDNGPVAPSLGIPVVKIQTLFFVLGSALGGLSGALIGSWTRVISTDSFGINLAIGIFLMLLLGGVDSMWGPILGAAFYVGIPYVLTSLQQYQTMVYGAMLLVVIVVLPQGIVGLVRQVADRVRRRPARREPTVIERLSGPEGLPVAIAKREADVASE